MIVFKILKLRSGDMHLQLRVSKEVTINNTWILFPSQNGGDLALQAPYLCWSSCSYCVLPGWSSFTSLLSAGISKYSKNKCRRKNPRLNDYWADYGHHPPVRLTTFKLYSVLTKTSPIFSLVHRRLNCRSTLDEDEVFFIKKGCNI